MSLGQFLEREGFFHFSAALESTKMEGILFFRSREFLRLTAIRSVRRRSEAEEAGGCDRSSSSSVRINPRVERESARMCTEPNNSGFLEWNIVFKAPFTCISSRSLLDTRGQFFLNKNLFVLIWEIPAWYERASESPPSSSFLLPTEKPGHRGKGKGKEADAKSEGEGGKAKGEKKFTRSPVTKGGRTFLPKTTIFSPKRKKIKEDTCGYFSHRDLPLPFGKKKYRFSVERGGIDGSASW